MRLSHRDFAMFNEAVALMYTLAFKRGALHAIADTLPRLLGGEVGAAAVAGPRGMESAMTRPEALPPLEGFLELYMTHPREQRPDLQGQVVKISDLVSRGAWHRQDLYQGAYRPQRIEDDLGTAAPLEDGSLLKVCLMRDRRTFRERERDMFTLLLPHFRALLERECPHCEASSLEGLGLTRREQEVLFWVAEGKTNRETGEILGISPGTVRVHLERIYPKLGVENRHGATLRVLERLRRVRESE